MAACTLREWALSAIESRGFVSLLTPHFSQGHGTPCHYTLQRQRQNPKLRHSAHSRGIHVPLHSNLDAATTRSMTACAGQRCPHYPHHSPSFLPPHPNPVIPGLTRNLPSSGCLYFAGMGTFSNRIARFCFTSHASLLSRARHAVPLHPSKTAAEPQTSSFRAQSRNPCSPALQLGCCDYAQHDGVCRATLPPLPTPFPVFPHSSLLTPTPSFRD